MLCCAGIIEAIRFTSLAGRLPANGNHGYERSDAGTGPELFQRVFWFGARFVSRFDARFNPRFNPGIAGNLWHRQRHGNRDGFFRLDASHDTAAGGYPLSGVGCRGWGTVE